MTQSNTSDESEKDLRVILTVLVRQHLFQYDPRNPDYNPAGRIVPIFLIACIALSHSLSRQCLANSLEMKTGDKNSANQRHVSKSMTIQLTKKNEDADSYV